MRDKKMYKIHSICHCFGVASLPLVLKRSTNVAVNYLVIPYIEEKFGDIEFIFQLDLAPLNTVKSTKQQFREKRIPILDLLQITQMQIQ